MVPENVIDKPVDVFLELPRQAALSDSRNSRYRDEPRAALSGERIERLFQGSQLFVSSDEGSFDAFGAADALALRDDSKCPPPRTGSSLPFKVSSPTSENAIA